MKQNRQKTEILLDYLHNKALDNEEYCTPLDAIITFVNSDNCVELADIIIPKMTTDIDFHSYFVSKESIEELKQLKLNDNDLYHNIIYYESILLNMMVQATEIPYIIVLNPEDLDKSYYLQIRLK